VVLVGLAFLIGCGDEGEPTKSSPGRSATQSGQTQADKPHKPSSSEIVATCSTAFGQDLSARPPGKPAFMECLERMNAPQDVIDAWK